MNYYKGIHFYININNFEDIVDDEESKQKKLSHSIHLLNSYFSGIERYARTNCNNVEIEKITSGRIHLYTTGSVEETLKDVLKIICFAYEFSKQIMRVGKYNSLLDMVISVGASYGAFFAVDMKLDAETNEFTSIGFACNYAAKLQSAAGNGVFAFDDDIFKGCSQLKLACYSRENKVFYAKYGQGEYYVANLSSLMHLPFIRESSINSFIDDQISDLNSKLLGDMTFTDTNKNLNFDSLSLNDGRKFVGVPFYSDVRNFTSKFNSADANLTEMASKVMFLMKTAFDIVNSNGGTHVQFQGDREFAVFVISENNADTLVNPIIAGLRMIDAVQTSVGLKVGIGISFGKLHATRVGIRNSKDNLLIGRVVNGANTLEDSCAGDNQIAISSNLFKQLKANGQNDLCSIFKKHNDEVYITSCGYKNYLSIVQKNKLEKANSSNSYNGAWRSK